MAEWSEEMIAVVQPQTRDATALAAFEAELKEMPYRRELASFDMRIRRL